MLKLPKKGRARRSGARPVKSVARDVPKAVKNALKDAVKAERNAAKVARKPLASAAPEDRKAVRRCSGPGKFCRHRWSNDSP